MNFPSRYLPRLRATIIPAGISSWAAARSKYSTQFIECQTWEQAVKDSTGYNDSEILDRVDAATRSVISGEALFERDGVLFQGVEQRAPVANALIAAQSRDGFLRVLDFGGALGSFYWQHRSLLAPLSPEWAIVEQQSYVERGHNLPTAEVSFHSDLDAALASVEPNVILFSSVLQYLPDPLETLRKMSNVSHAQVVIDRTPIHFGDRNIPTVQKVPPHIYRGSYPAWIISELELKSCFSATTSVTWFSGIEPAGRTRQGTPFQWKGLLATRNSP